MAYNPNDYYFRKAKAQKYVARSIFKLEEIDKKYKIFSKGDVVLDLGAAPGSWSQYASQMIGPKGFVLGIDLKSIGLSLSNARFIQMDIYDLDLESVAQEFARFKLPVDLLISDMAPKTTGVKLADQMRSLELCEQALRVAEEHLKPGGNFVCKLFHSGSFDEFRDQMRERFEKVRALRPKSTRKESKEVFMIGLGHKGIAPRTSAEPTGEEPDREL